MGYLILGILLLGIEFRTGLIEKWASLPLDVVSLYLMAYGIASVLAALTYGESIWKGLMQVI
jgi:hypothetical protein